MSQLWPCGFVLNTRCPSFPRRPLALPPACHVFWEVGRVRDHGLGYTNASQEPEVGCGLPVGRPLIPLQPLIWARVPAKTLWFCDLVNLGCGQARDPRFPGPALTTPSECQARGHWLGQLMEAAGLGGGRKFFPGHGGFKGPGNPILNRPSQGRADTTDDISPACLLVPTVGKWLSLSRHVSGL